MSDQSTVMVPRWLWESLGGLLRECDISCTVPVRVGSSTAHVEAAGLVTGTGVRADGRALVWVAVDFGDGLSEHEMVAGDTSDWGLS